MDTYIKKTQDLRGRRYPSAEERFWIKVNKNGPIHPILQTACWLWTGCEITGYGQFNNDNRKVVYVHVFSYELHYGPVPLGLEVDHFCSIRNCVRPEHLEAVTPKENCRRRDAYNKRIRSLNKAIREVTLVKDR